MKIIDSVWITCFGLIGCIGIVVAENEVGERKAYVGIGYGINQQSDEELIVRDCGKLTAESSRHIMELLEKTK